MLLADIGPGDEVIMPSFTFVSTANAFVLRGATPVFVDIREDTLNLDETLVEAAITRAPRRSSPCTTAAWPATWTRYDVADAAWARLIEDAAHALGRVPRRGRSGRSAISAR